MTIDVLAVMLEDAHDASLERQWDYDAKQRSENSDEARSAVSELIEAAREYRAMFASFRKDCDLQEAVRQRRLDAILDRIGETK